MIHTKAIKVSLAGLLVIVMSLYTTILSAGPTSSLTPTSTGTVDGYKLPDIRGAGWPNFENHVRVKWVNNPHTGARLTAWGVSSESIFNLTPTESFAVTPGIYLLRATFDTSGALISGNVSIRGRIVSDTLNANGTLMTANLETFNHSDDLLGFNTTNIVCPWFDFCTTDESAYIKLDGGGFDPDLRKFDATGLAVTTVPIPAGVWLFGSGLIGLAAVMRRKKSA